MGRGGEAGAGGSERNGVSATTSKEASRRRDRDACRRLRRRAERGATTRRRPCAGRGERAAPWNGSRNASRAVSGGRARRRRGAGKPGRPWAIGDRKRGGRFCGNVPAAGVRRKPGGDAPRCRGANHRSRCTHHARSRRRSAVRSSIATKAVASRAAGCAQAKAITSAIGPTAARRHFRTSRCCAAVITAPYTKRAIGWSAYSTASSCSGDRTGELYPTCHRRRRYPRIPRRRSVWRTKREAFTSMHKHRSPAGWASGWTSATRSVCCTR